MSETPEDQWVVQYADGRQVPIERPVTPEEFRSPPRQSPRERLSEIEEVSGGNASGNIDVSDWYFTDIDGQLRDVISGLRHLGPAEIEDLLSVPVPDYAAGVPLSDVDEAVIRRISEGERDHKGNLIWLRQDGERR